VQLPFNWKFPYPSRIQLWKKYENLEVNQLFELVIYYSKEEFIVSLIIAIIWYLPTSEPCRDGQVVRKKKD